MRNCNANRWVTAVRSANEISVTAQSTTLCPPPWACLSSQLPFSPLKAMIHLTSGIILSLLFRRKIILLRIFIFLNNVSFQFNMCTWSHNGRVCVCVCACVCVRACVHSCCSVAKSCLTLPMNCSMAGSPVLHCFLEFAQIHVHWVSDAIQPSHPLSPSSPFAFNPSQHQGLF